MNTSSRRHVMACVAAALFMLLFAVTGEPDAEKPAPTAPATATAAEMTKTTAPDAKADAAAGTESDPSHNPKPVPPPPPPKPLNLAPNGGAGTKVMVIPIKEEIAPVLNFAVRRAFREAASMENLSAIIIDMDTPGGRVDITEEIIDRIRASKVPVYVYVNPRAYSAGSIISLACKGIYMAPGANIGAAAPIMMAPGGGIQEMPDRIQEKITSVMRGLVRGLAEENGYDPNLAEALVDQNHEDVVIEGKLICKKGHLLVLTANEACQVIPPRTKPILATGIVKDMAGMKAALGLQNAVEIDMKATPSEHIARWLTLLTPLLGIVFMLCLYVEINTPGFGAAGTVAIVCLVILLFGQYVAGLAGYEEMALIVLGIALLIVELFFIPGFGVVGLLGIACILTGLFLVLLPNMPTNLPALPGTDGVTHFSDINQLLTNAFLIVCGVLAGSGVSMWAITRYLPSIGPFSQLVLKKASRAEDGYVAVEVNTPRQMIGHTGVALTALRPAGVAKFGDKRLDVVTSGDYIEKGQAVVIRRVNGPRIEVEISPSQPEQA